MEDKDSAKLLGEPIISPEYDIAGVKATLDFVDCLQRSALPDAIVGWLMADVRNRISSLRMRLCELGKNYSQFQQFRGEFAHLTQINDVADFFHDIGTPNVTFGQIARKAEQAIQATAELSPWLSYLRARQELKNSGLARLVELAEEGHVPAEEMRPATSYLYQNALLLSAFSAFPTLATFDGIAHNQVREDFARLDTEIIASLPSRIVRKLLQMKTPQGKQGIAPSDSNFGEPEAIRNQRVGNYTDMTLIRHILMHPKARVRPREIIERASAALLAWKPCFMMSPLSVAQFLPPTVNFDIVVIDEASQLKVEDSLGAIARASQVVIVGDPRQLPPSNFFQKKLSGDDDNADDELLAVNSESILEHAGAIYEPPRMLTWHYRSRHQDLINFSNEYFYSNKLVVFPSPFSSGIEPSVEFIHVQRGVYADQVNKIEAQRVAGDAIAHLQNHPKTSLGIVAMNQKQKEAIEELFEEALKANENARKTIERLEAQGEDVFVKNLENVQGDERDVIFISVNIGLDERGYLPLNRLGMLNWDGAERRLNVLVTRAKKRMVVYASFLPEDLNISNNSSLGARILKEYLAYARRLGFGIHDEKKRLAETDFQEVLCDVLNKKGYEAVPRVGVESYWIDVAVVHPNDKGRYILGIESDGALYQSAKSVCERDRLRQSVLEKMGWNLHRIWSADWFRHRDREVDKLVQRIEALL